MYGFLQCTSCRFAWRGKYRDDCCLGAQGCLTEYLWSAGGRHSWWGSGDDARAAGRGLGRDEVRRSLPRLLGIDPSPLVADVVDDLRLRLVSPSPGPNSFHVSLWGEVGRAGIAGSLLRLFFKRFCDVRVTIPRRTELERLAGVCISPTPLERLSILEICLRPIDISADLEYSRRENGSENLKHR